MKNNHNDVILSGINVDLNNHLKNVVTEKIQKLFEHESQIIRVRVELEHNENVANKATAYRAQGRIEIKGPDMIASSEGEDPLKCVDLLVDKLVRMLRRRSRTRKVKRKENPHLDIPAELPQTAVS